MPRQPWETPKDHAARVRFVVSEFGATPPEGEKARMRQAALSMVYSNMRLLGCRYPEQVEKQAAASASQPEARSGYAVDGQMAAARALREAS